MYRLMDKYGIQIVFYTIASISFIGIYVRIIQENILSNGYSKRLPVR